MLHVYIISRHQRSVVKGFNFKRRTTHHIITIINAIYHLFLSFIHCSFIVQ